MSFHHVLVSVEPEPARLRCVLTDLSEEELYANFVRPYRKGQNLVCGNEIFPIAHIRKVHIVRTAHESEDERRVLQEKNFKEIQELNREPSGVVFMSLGRGYDPKDILEAGEDITAKFVLGPPGSASEPSLITRLLSNQWTVAIGTGLVVAGLVLVAWMELTAKPSVGRTHNGGVRSSASGKAVPPLRIKSEVL